MGDDVGEYTATAKLLHWLIAAFIVVQVALGLYMTRGALGHQLKFELYQLHKSMGITVLMLMAVRVFWRFLATTPAWPGHMRQWKRRAARNTHIALYALLLMVPLSGWAMISAVYSPFSFPTQLFNTIPWPHIPAIENLSVGQKKTVEPYLKNVHAALGWVLLALVLLHVAAALRHALILKDGVMLRMVPRFLKASTYLIVPFALMTVFVACASPALAQEWAINKEKSRITFEFDAGGRPIAGEFQHFRAEIRFDPDHLDISEISAAIDANTINTGQPQVNDALLTREWFDVQTYPAVGFRAISVEEGEADGAYVMEGELTIKGRTKRISIPFALTIDQGEAQVMGETEINRQNFAVGPSEPSGGTTIGDRIKVKLDLLATRLDN